MKKWMGIVVVAFVLSGFACYGQTIMYSPHRATGWEGIPGQSGQYKTEFGVFNPTDSPVSVIAFFTDPHANPVQQIITNADGLPVRDSNISFTLEKKGETRFTLSSDAGLSTGTIAFLVPNAELSVQVVFIRLDPDGNVTASAGVSVIPLMVNSAIQVRADSETDVGFAAYNPGAAPNKLTLRLYRTIADGIAEIFESAVTLQAGEQLSKYVSQLFPQMPVLANGVIVPRGHLEIISEYPIAATAIQLYFKSGYTFAGIPILEIQ